METPSIPVSNQILILLLFCGLILHLCLRYLINVQIVTVVLNSTPFEKNET